MQIHGLNVTRNGDNEYQVTTPQGRVVGGVVKWYQTDAVNKTGVPKFRHPWGDTTTLAEAVEQFTRILWVQHALLG